MRDIWSSFIVPSHVTHAVQLSAFWLLSRVRYTADCCNWVKGKVELIVSIELSRLLYLHLTYLCNLLHVEVYDVIHLQWRRV